MKRLRNIIETNKVLFKNFTSLSILQLTNYLFPLITLPYLVRVLGPEKYGLVMFVLSFTSYWGILIDYGFNLSATKYVSIFREDNNKLSEQFSTVFFARVVLFGFSILVFGLLIIFFPLFNENLELYIISITGLIGTILFPTYLFQGIEKMHHILIINFIIRSISVVAIFTFIRDSSDFVILILIYSSTNILIGITGFRTAVHKYNIRLFFPGIVSTKDILVKSFNIFISSLSISTISNSNAFILGLFAESKMVGYFAAADKIRLAFQSALLPLLTTMFARINKTAKDSLNRFNEITMKFFLIIFLAALLLSIILFSLSPLLVKVLLGESFADSIKILNILSPLPLLFAISNFIGVLILIPLGKENEYSKIMFATLIFHTLLSLLIVPLFLSEGSAIAALATELFLILLFVLYLYKNKNQI